MTGKQPISQHFFQFLVPNFPIFLFLSNNLGIKVKLLVFYFERQRQEDLDNFHNSRPRLGKDFFLYSISRGQVNLCVPVFSK